MLSSIAIRHLQEYCKQEVDCQQYAVLYLFIDSYDTKTQIYSNLIRSALRQLLSGLEPIDLCEEVQDFVQDSRKDLRPDDQAVLQLLEAQASSPATKRVYLVVDALDEFPEESREELLNTLRTISPSKVSLLITSRDFDEINESNVRCTKCPEQKQRNLNLYFRCVTCPTFHLCQECKDANLSCEWNHALGAPSIVYKKVSTPDDEIERYIRHVIVKELHVAENRPGDNVARTGTIAKSRLGILYPKYPHEREELSSNIIKAVVGTAGGMFLLAKLHFETLKSQSTLGELKRALRDLSTEVDQMYTKLLKRIRNQSQKDVTLAMQALGWVVHARRPLKVPELIQIMAVNPRDEEFLPEEQTDFTIVMRVTMGLLCARGEQGSVELVHLTAKEYFHQLRKEILPDAQIELTMKMLTYLKFNALRSPCIGDKEDQLCASRLEEYPFFAYACTYWGDHVHEVMKEHAIRDSTMTFLKDPFRVAASAQGAWYVGSESQDKILWAARKGVNALHLCAWFGLDAYITSMLSRPHDAQTNAQDERHGRNPLMYACMRGHTSTALLLLAYRADAEQVDKQGSNAVFLALTNGHADLVERLLKQDLDPPLNLNAISKQYDARTLLMLATINGHASLVSTLLRRPGVEVNAEDAHGDTALTLAAANASTVIVKTLLEYADINAPNAIGSTALMIAAERGRDGIVSELLENDADWGPRNKDGHTALSKALIHGHTGVVKVLLEHNVEYQAADASRQTALHFACSCDKTKPDMIEALLQAGLKVNAQDSRERTPLHVASRVGNLDVAKTLLGSRADQSIKDYDGRTPQFTALQNGHANLVTLFQDYAKQGGQTLESLPGTASLALWSLAKIGEADLLQNALQSKNVEVDQRDPDTESTALHWAIRSDKLEKTKLKTIELLLKAGAGVNEVDDHKRTPLHIAAYLDIYEATDLLLQHKANPNVRSSWDVTPLSIAQSRIRLVSHNSFTAVRLLKAGAAVEQASPWEMQETFCAALEIGFLDVAKMLVGRGVDIEGRNAKGKTVLHLAMASGVDESLEWVRKLIYHPT